MSEKSNTAAGPDAPTPADAHDEAPTADAPADVIAPADAPAQADDSGAEPAADAGAAGAGTTGDPSESATPDGIEAADAAEPGAGEVARLTDEVARLEREKQEIYDRLLRQAADLENFRRRSKRDIEDARTAAQTAVLKEMLPVVDNLELAVKHADAPAAPAGGGEPAGNASGIIDGVKLVLRQFGQAFERCGVTPIEAQGAPFDPNLHEAISQIETTEHPPGSVAQVYQRGYKIGERLLRPSLVVVAKAPPEAAPEPAEDADDTTQRVDVPEVPASEPGGADAIAEVPEPADGADDATQPVEVPELPSARAPDGEPDRETDD